MSERIDLDEKLLQESTDRLEAEDVLSSVIPWSNLSLGILGSNMSSKTLWL